MSVCDKVVNLTEPKRRQCDVGEADPDQKSSRSCISRRLNRQTKHRKRPKHQDGDQADRAHVVDPTLGVSDLHAQIVSLLCVESIDRMQISDLLEQIGFESCEEHHDSDQPKNCFFADEFRRSVPRCPKKQRESHKEEKPEEHSHLKTSGVYRSVLNLSGKPADHRLVQLALVGEIVLQDRHFDTTAYLEFLAFNLVAV